MNVMEHEKQADVAVFFDFENIVFSLRNNYNINANFEDLMDKCKEFGRVVVAHSFADWNRHSPAMIPALMSNGFDPVYVPSFTMGSDGQQSVRKNAVDMYMAIDAMDILHNRKSVDTFILLTGDSDFLPLVNAIRREGRRVIAIGVDGSTSSHLAQAVDEFIFYSQFSEIPTSAYMRRPRNIYEGLVEAIKALQSRQRSTVLPNVKMMMAELMGGFDEKKHTDGHGRRFQKFKEFVQEGERRNMVTLMTTGTVNEVFLADDERVKQARKSKSKSETPDAKSDSEPQQPTLNEAFDLLTKAASRAIAEGKSTRPSSVKGIMTSMYDGFNEKAIEVDNKKPFSRFGEFVKAAEDNGYVKVTGKGHSRRILPVEDEQEDETTSEPEKVAEPEKVTEAETATETQVEQEVPTTAVQKSQPEPKQKETAPVEKQAEVTALAIPPRPSDEDEAERTGREIIVAGLRSFNAYPAPFLKIEAYCRQVRNERNVYLPSPKVRELLTSATRSLGLLQRVSPPGVSPAQYEYKEDPRLVATFLGDDPDTAVVESAAEEPAKEEPTAPQKEEASPAPVKAEAEPQETDPRHEAFNLLAQAVANAESAKRSTRISAIKGQMRKIEADFSEKNITAGNGKPFKRLSDFVHAAAEAGYVTVSGTGRGMMVHSKDKDS